MSSDKQREAGGSEDGVRVSIEPLEEDGSSEVTSSEGGGAKYNERRPAELQVHDADAHEDEQHDHEVLEREGDGEDENLELLVKLGERYPRIGPIMDSVVARLRRRMDKRESNPLVSILTPHRRQILSVEEDPSRHQSASSSSSASSSASSPSSKSGSAPSEATPRPLERLSSSLLSKEECTPSPPQRESWAKWIKRSREKVGLVGELSEDIPTEKQDETGGFPQLGLFSPIRLWKRRRLAGDEKVGQGGDSVWTWVLRDDCGPPQGQVVTTAVKVGSELSESEYTASSSHDKDEASVELLSADDESESPSETEEHEIPNEDDTSSTSGESSAFGDNMYLPESLKAPALDRRKREERSTASWWKFACPTRNAFALF